MAFSILVLGAVWEVMRILLGEPWPGYAAWHSHTVSGVLAVLWIATAVTVLTRKSRKLTSNLGWALSFVAPASMVAHAFITRTGGSPWGLLYLPGAAGVALLSRAAWVHSGRHRWGRDPSREPAAPTTH